MSAPLTILAMLLAGAQADAAPPPAATLEAPAQQSVAAPETAPPPASAPQPAAAPVAPAGPEAAQPVADAPQAVSQDAPSQQSAAVPAEPADDGDAIEVTGSRTAKIDPLSKVNEMSYQAVQVVDKAVVGPASMGYRKRVPAPIRNGLRNVLNNLRDPGTFVNDVIQIKPGRAVRTLARFAINSTVGIAGLFDFARRKPFNLPFRINGFANSLGYYGIGPGPYLFLPVIGPTTLRDLGGRILDLSLLPTVVGEPFSSPAFGLVSGVVSSIDQRADYDAELRRIRASANPYALMRDTYLKQRDADLRALHSRQKFPGAVPLPLTQPQGLVPAVVIPPADAATQPAAPATPVPPSGATPSSPATPSGAPSIPSTTPEATPAPSAAPAPQLETTTP